MKKHSPVSLLAYGMVRSSLGCEHEIPPHKGRDMHTGRRDRRSDEALVRSPQHWLPGCVHGIRLRPSPTIIVPDCFHTCGMVKPGKHS